VDFGASNQAINKAATTIKTAVRKTTKNNAELLIRVFIFVNKKHAFKIRVQKYKQFVFDATILKNNYLFCYVKIAKEQCGGVL
jgi:hypothetical protein